MSCSALMPWYCHSAGTNGIMQKAGWDYRPRCQKSRAAKLWEVECTELGLQICSRLMSCARMLKTETCFLAMIFQINQRPWVTAHIRLYKLYIYIYTYLCNMYNYITVYIVNVLISMYTLTHMYIYIYRHFPDCIYPHHPLTEKLGLGR